MKIEEKKKNGLDLEWKVVIPSSSIDIKTLPILGKFVPEAI